MNFKHLLIKNARIIDTALNRDERGDIFISQGLIRSPGDLITGEDCGVIDGTALIACPGFIDLHCHLREPGQEAKETIETGTAAAARGGFSTVCCMPNTEPPIDHSALVEYIRRVAAEKSPIAVLPIGCITKGRAGQEIVEMAELARAGCVGFSDDGCSVANSRIMSLAMKYAAALDLPIIEHCEDPDLMSGGHINEGWVAVRLGLRGIPAAAEEAIVARDIALAEMTGVRLHLTHISTKGSVEIIRRAKDRGIKVTADVTPHHLTLTQEHVIYNKRRPGIDLTYDTNCKVNPPLRTAEDIRALIEGINDRTIDCIATDHAPHTLEEKLCEFETAVFGITGFETAFGVLMSLVQENKITLNRLIECLTCAPASILGKKAGITCTISPGAQANITLIDPNKEWEVQSASFISKGKNTPYDGKILKGMVVATIFSGRIVYAAPSFVSASRK